MLVKHIERFIFQPSSRPNSKTDYCEVYAYIHRDGSRKVIIISEAGDGYEGMSVTNGAPFIVKSLIEQEIATDQDVFIEHYSKAVRNGEETFDIIRYSNNNGRLSTKWAPFSRDETEYMIDEEF